MDLNVPPSEELVDGFERSPSEELVDGSERSPK